MKKILSKRFLPLFLTLTTVFSLFSFSVSAAGTDIVFEENLDGDTLTVRVYVVNAAKLNIANISLFFDNAVLDFNGYMQEGTDSEELYKKEYYYHARNDYSDPPTYAGVFSEDLAYVVPADSPMLSKYHIINLVFTVKPGAAYKVKGTKISLECDFTVNNAVCLIDKTYTVTSGKEKPVPKLKLGDVDGDNSISAADARLILRCSVGLDKIPVDLVAYANFDFDNAITAADARAALRTSVGLEKIQTHSFVMSGDKFSCSCCNNSFKLDSRFFKPHTHNYIYIKCYECSCGATKGDLPLHELDATTMKCKLCGYDFNSAMLQIGEVQRLFDSALNYIDAVNDDFDDLDFHSLIRNLTKLESVLNEIPEIIKDNKDLADVYKHFDAAAKGFSAEMDYYRDANGAIKADVYTASMLYAAVGDVIEQLGNANSALKVVLEKYIEMGYGAIK